jgi:4-amino-4-deoxy-L-arabinose transferase-like glycosyltransferase
LQKGQQPGIDYVAEQQPLFLLAGKTVLELFGRSPTFLRLLSTAQVLAGCLVLFYALTRVWNTRVAFIAIGLILTTGLVYQQARLFRPDPMMFGWELAGLGAVLLAVHSRERKYWAVAGILYGVALLWKLFAVFPIFGLVLYFAHNFWRNRQQRSPIFKDGFTFAVFFSLIGLGITLVLYFLMDFYYLEAFDNHLNSGLPTTFQYRASLAFQFYLFFILLNGVFVFIVPLWLLNKPKGWRKNELVHLLLWQLVSPAIFLAITRPIHLRYLLYLVPIFAILLAWQLDLAFIRLGEQNGRIVKTFPAVIGVILLFAVAITQPAVPNMLIRQETDTLELAGYIASITQPGDIVLGDYAGINYFADRDSIYEASIIARAQIEGQVITGQMLIDRMEEKQVEVVFIHTGGGSIDPHLIALVDFEQFSNYIDENFVFVRTFKRVEQNIDIFQRKGD